MKNYIFIILGSFSVLLGFIGIFLPLLPTTIFLIIGSYFFMKGSPKLNEKLINHKLFGPFIKNYRDEKGMPLKSKINAIALLWISILISTFLFTKNLILQIVLIVIAISVSIYISFLKTLKK